MCVCFFLADLGIWTRAQFSLPRLGFAVAVEHFSGSAARARSSSGHYLGRRRTSVTNELPSVPTIAHLGSRQRLPCCCCDDVRRAEVKVGRGQVFALGILNAEHHPRRDYQSSRSTVPRRSCRGRASRETGASFFIHFLVFRGAQAVVHEVTHRTSTNLFFSPGSATQ